MRFKSKMNNDSVGYFSLEMDDGHPVPFLGAQIDAVVKSTSIETVIQQRFKNTEQCTIEAIYNFPLPTDAVLMSLHLTLNDKRYIGVVKEAKQAAEEYEDAITDGDSAMMLQKISDNLYSLSVGNMQPNDDVLIEIRYAQLLKWQGTQLRLMIPMTLAPRYGNSAKLGLAPEQKTASTLDADFKAGITVTILDELAKAGIKSPTHTISFQQVENGVVITAGDGNVPMDRDFILTITQTQKKIATAYYDKDINDQWISWLSFTPEIAVENPLPRHLKIVVDCSGSMEGDSINQAKVAVREIVEILSENDYFNIVNFGNTSESLFAGSELASAQHKKKAYAWIAKTEADMGGTELGGALQQAYRSESVGTSATRPDVLLITDGQTSDVKAIVAAAAKSRHRHFTVGVGSAVSEDVVRGLAEKTDGACELVTPNEKMADSIVRHANRASVPRMTSANIIFPNLEKALNATPLHQVYSGDTVHFFAQLNEQPQGNAYIKLQFGEVCWEENMVFQPYGNQLEADNVENLTLARMAAAQRMQASEDKQAIVKLGVDYQLQSKETNYLVVVERENKDESAFGPELRQVDNMLPAGWGGSSTVMEYSKASYRSGDDDEVEWVSKLLDGEGIVVNKLIESSIGKFAQEKHIQALGFGSDDYDFDFDSLDSNKYIIAKKKMPDFIAFLNSGGIKIKDTINVFNPLSNQVAEMPQSLKIIQNYLDDSVIAALNSCLNGYISEEDLILEFLYQISQIEEISEMLDKRIKRAIMKSYKLQFTDVLKDKAKSEVQLGLLKSLHEELIETIKNAMTNETVIAEWRNLPWR